MVRKLPVVRETAHRVRVIGEESGDKSLLLIPRSAEESCSLLKQVESALQDWIGLTSGLEGLILTAQYASRRAGSSTRSTGVRMATEPRSDKSDRVVCTRTEMQLLVLLCVIVCAIVFLMVWR